VRALPAGLQAHLDEGATTLCWCWRVTRADGVVSGFTDHDRDVAFGGVTYEAASGFSASDIESAVGLGVDNLDVESVLSSEGLTETDLAAGRYDGASVDIWRVNWEAPDQRVLMKSGHLGEVTRGRLSFRAEVRGLAHVLNQARGRIFQYGCDADLGDARCKVGVSLSAYRGLGEVTAVIGPRSFRASGLGAYATDWFARGVLRWTSGANEGLAMEVKAHVAASGAATIELWRSMASAIAEGDGFEITAGCDKQFATCRTKFGNEANFRGFPHLPGNDFALSYPVRGDGGNDGGSLAG
jgi:uncharacterized phage protein (TIGR02218 family)